jgi:hypothetical protein
MLNETPVNRPNASEVWEHLKDMVETRGAKPYCEHDSPAPSIPVVEKGTENVEIMVSENFAFMFIE